ncbi:hypothetical protein M758_8G078800 [Ceratodon purpureus]|uniref:Uncharacterized protein n=1 Tax=Ceratodon purpureus TaxID=3225 RepID=A0A8T0H079_CERPU|nr:hypothetical protein KC19_8G084100 [Ceratodon purpureus]KAG0608109.1 hypothetical protein M758_8G078800 [Ceratodon purpureus]
MAEHNLCCYSCVMGCTPFTNRKDSRKWRWSLFMGSSRVTPKMHTRMHIGQHGWSELGPRITVDHRRG